MRRRRIVSADTLSLLMQDLAFFTTVGRLEAHYFRLAALIPLLFSCFSHPPLFKASSSSILSFLFGSFRSPSLHQ